MKLVWSPETASKAYIETVKSCEINGDSGVAELISAMAAGWNARLIVETWSRGGATATSIGLAVASRHTCGRHVCIVLDAESQSEYNQAMEEAGVAAEVIVATPETALEEICDIDFMVVDCQHEDFAKILTLAKLGQRGAVLVCKNANSRIASNFRWRTVLKGGCRHLVRSAFLPVGKGLDIAHVAACEGNRKSGKGDNRRWIKHFDSQSGEEIVIRK